MIGERPDLGVAERCWLLVAAGVTGGPTVPWYSGPRRVGISTRTPPRAAGPDSTSSSSRPSLALVWSLVTTSFSDLGVSPELVSRLRAGGVTAPFPIQAATVPDALAGRDVCGKAPTGSGKTLAFALAIVDRAHGTPGRPAALVLVPTRELAAQVQRELASLAGPAGRRVLAIYGGTSYGPARKALAQGVDTIIACPGRLEDLVEQGAVDLSGVRIVVLDEADRMADMGFLPAVRRLVDLTAPRRQVLLFSATLGPEIETLVRRYQTNPARHDVVGEESVPVEVSQLFWGVARDERLAVTTQLVEEYGRALVFCRTRRGCDRLARQLKAAGVEAAAIHGDLSQAQRERALSAFGAGRARALVATDVAARGIHVEGLGCVVHYDPPSDLGTYMHRSGRTGRAGQPGTVVSLVTDEDRATNRAWQRSLGFDGRLGTPVAGSARTLGPRTPRPAPASEVATVDPKRTPSHPPAPTRTDRRPNGHPTNGDARSAGRGGVRRTAGRRGGRTAGRSRRAR